MRGHVQTKRAKQPFQNSSASRGQRRMRRQGSWAGSKTKIFSHTRVQLGVGSSSSGEGGGLEVASSLQPVALNISRGGWTVEPQVQKPFRTPDGGGPGPITARGAGVRSASP